MDDGDQNPTTRRGVDRKAEVWSACNRVCGRGKKPSLSEVRAEGVKGSDGDVHTYIKSWYDEVFAAHLGRTATMGMPDEVAVLFADVYERCRDLASDRFSDDRRQMEAEKAATDALVDSLHGRIAHLEANIRELAGSQASLELSLAEVTERLVGAKSEIEELLRIQRMRDDEHRVALLRQDELHQRSIAHERSSRQSLLDEHEIVRQRLERDIARIEDQYGELLREKAQAVEGQRQAASTIERLERQKQLATNRITELEIALKGVTAERERLRAEVANLASRSEKTDSDAPRFLRRLRAPVGRR